MRSRSCWSLMVLPPAAIITVRRRVYRIVQSRHRRKSATVEAPRHRCATHIAPPPTSRRWKRGFCTTRVGGSGDSALTSRRWKRGFCTNLTPLAACRPRPARPGGAQDCVRNHKLRRAPPKHRPACSSMRASCRNCRSAGSRPSRCGGARQAPARQSLSGKVAIVGHTPQPSGEIFDLRFLLCLETHGARGGWLTAREVETGQVWQPDYTGRLREERRNLPVGRCRAKDRT